MKGCGRLPRQPAGFRLFNIDEHEGFQGLRQTILHANKGIRRMMRFGRVLPFETEENDLAKQGEKAKRSVVAPQDVFLNLRYGLKSPHVASWQDRQR